MLKLRSLLLTTTRPAKFRGFQCFGSERWGLTDIVCRSPSGYFACASFSTDSKNGQKVRASSTVQEPFSARVFRSFGLNSTAFDDQAFQEAFDRADLNKDGKLDTEEVRVAVNASLCGKIPENNMEEFIDQFIRKFDIDKDGAVTREEFLTSMTDMASKVDPRAWPIAASTLVVGMAVGIIIPAMPQLVQQLEISASGFGVVVGSLALSKMLGNIPFAIAVDRYGRKPFLTAGLGMMMLGMFGVGMSGSLEHLVAARLVTGLGIASFVTASSLYMADISTALNRARTMAPMSIAFSAGAMLGPVLGGVLTESIGVPATFATVGGIFALLAGTTQITLTETKPEIVDCDSLDKAAAAPQSLSATLLDTWQQWRELASHRDLRAMFGLNALYWMALSGSQMTMLPLILVEDDRFGLGPQGIGAAFAFMSAINVAFAQPGAALADRFGKRTVIIPACTALALGQGLFPLASTLPEAGALIGVWALGSSLLGTAPTAYVADLTKSHNRAQALALLRVTGDVGMLVGASASGAIADMSGDKGTAMQVNSMTLLLATLMFAARGGGGGGGRMLPPPPSPSKA